MTEFGSQWTLPRCPKCGKESPEISALYCEFCGVPLYPADAHPAYGRANGHPVAPIGTPAALSYAGFWKRLAAWLIDQLVLVAAALLAGVVTFTTLIVVTGEEDPDLGWWPQVFWIVLNWLYYALLESAVGATLGKMAVGLRVTDLAGNRPSFRQTTGRHFGKIISRIPLGAGFLMAAWTEQKQTLHDQFSGCLVVNR